MENDIKTSTKVVDFIIGYFGFFIISAILSFVTSSLSNTSFVNLLLTFDILCPILILTVGNTVIKKRRRYMAKGINFAVITAILIPVIFFGACLLMFSSGGLR